MTNDKWQVGHPRRPGHQSVVSERVILRRRVRARKEGCNTDDEIEELDSGHSQEPEHGVLNEDPDDARERSRKLGLVYSKKLGQALMWEAGAADEGGLASTDKVQPTHSRR